MENKKWIVISVIFIILAGFIYSVSEKDKKAPEALEEINLWTTEPGTEESRAFEENTGEEEIKKKSYFYVHICGEVKIPGVYKVEEGSRIIDLVRLAGGFTQKASEDFVNQAQVAADGERIYIPSIDETKGSLNTGKPENGKTDGKININTASKEELMKLSGIGEAKADSIIAYREKNGAFKKTEELKQIEGIKDGLYNKVRDHITIG